jgi:8-oxo-dGTP diphosphatase
MFMPLMPEDRRMVDGPVGTSKPWGLAVRAVVRDEAGRWLLVRRSSQSKHFAGTWELPGGKLDPGETVDVALRREVREETGLAVRPSGVAGVTECEMAKAHVVVLYFDTVMEAGAVTLSAEHDAFTWVAPAELRALDLNPQMKDFFGNDHTHP